MTVRAIVRPIVRPIVRKIMGGLGGLGPELVTNGTFAADLTGWTNASTNPAAVVEWVAGAMHLLNPDAGGTIRSEQNIALVSGRRYRARFTASGFNGGSIQFMYGGSTLVQTSSNGMHEVTFTAGVSMTIAFLRAFPVELTVDNVSVRQVL